MTTPTQPPSTRPAPPAATPPDRSQLIIDQPRLQGRTQRVVSGTVTAVAWFVWAYLWLPLVTLVAWYFGVRSFVREVFIPDSSTVVWTGVTYLVVIFLLGVVLLTWSRYNLRRFGGAERRAATPPLTAEEVTAWFGISRETLATLHTGGSLVVEHGPEGEVQGVRVPDPSAGGPPGGGPSDRETAAGETAAMGGEKELAGT
jgi:biofilm PGA synthesis protein PgaD